MRRISLLLVGLFLLSVSAQPVASRVLVPGDEAPSGSGSEKQPNLGLLPVQNEPAAPPPPTTTASPPKTTPAPTPSAAAPSTSSGIDKIDPRIFQDLDIGALRKSLPAESQGLSEEEIRGTLSFGLSKLNDDNLKKNVTRNAETGEVKVDYEGLYASMDQVERERRVNLVPGGRLEKTIQDSKDKQTATLLSQGSRAAAIAKAMETREPAKLNMPPMIVEGRAMLEYDNQGLKNRAAVIAPSDYVWSDADVKRIKTALGYAPDDIPLNCQLRFDVSVKTDDGKSLYNATVMAGEQKRIPFNGKLKSLDTRSFAVCNPPPKDALPQSGRALYKYYDKFAVQLGKPACPFSGKEANTSADKLKVSVLFQYAGNAGLSCAFQKQ